MLRLLLLTTVAFVLANTSFADQGMKAINGHTMELDGDVMIVQGVICPSIDTPEGMDAKRLANTYAHGRNVTCEVISNFGAAWRGDCKLKSNNGNTLSQTLIDSGLCKSGKITMDCGIVQRLLGWCA